MLHSFSTQFTYEFPSFTRKKQRRKIGLENGERAKESASKKRGVMTQILQQITAENLSR
jgi:hypothetical protein